MFCSVAHSWRRRGWPSTALPLPGQASCICQHVWWMEPWAAFQMSLLLSALVFLRSRRLCIRARFNHVRSHACVFYIEQCIYTYVCIYIYIVHIIYLRAFCSAHYTAFLTQCTGVAARGWGSRPAGPGLVVCYGYIQPEPCLIWSTVVIKHIPSPNPVSYSLKWYVMVISSLTVSYGLQWYVMVIKHICSPDPVSFCLQCKLKHFMQYQWHHIVESAHFPKPFPLRACHKNLTLKVYTLPLLAFSR